MEILVAVLVVIIAVLVAVILWMKSSYMCRGGGNMHRTWDDAVEEAMEDFDFGRAASIMDFLRWGWLVGDSKLAIVPDEDAIRERVREMVADAVAGINREKSDRYFVTTGGYEVIATHSGDGNPQVVIKFVAVESGVEGA